MDNRFWVVDIALCDKAIVMTSCVPNIESDMDTVIAFAEAGIGGDMAFLDAAVQAAADDARRTDG